MYCHASLPSHSCSTHEYCTRINYHHSHRTKLCVLLQVTVTGDSENKWFWFSLVRWRLVSHVSGRHACMIIIMIMGICHASPNKILLGALYQCVHVCLAVIKAMRVLFPIFSRRLVTYTLNFFYQIRCKRVPITLVPREHGQCVNLYTGWKCKVLPHLRVRFYPGFCMFYTSSCNVLHKQL